jgi:hypothetical protein
MAAALVGFAIPDSRMVRDNLTSSGFSQAGPHPGVAVASDTLSDFVPQISNEQSDEYVVKALTAGMPVLSQGTRAGYRKSSEAAAKLRGWNPYSLLQGWVAGEYSPAATATFTYPSACVIPSSQKVVSVYSNIGAFTSHCRSYDPYTATWSASASVVADGGTNSIWSVACLPSERLLAVLNGASNLATSVAYYSDDDGVTWSVFAEGVLPAAITASSRLRARLYVVGDDILYVVVTSEAGPTTHLHHYVSSSNGVTFREVEDWSSPGGTPDVVALVDGRIGVVTINAGTNLPQWRIVSNAWDTFSDATAANIDASQTVSEVAACVDQAGAIWVYGRSSGSWYVWRSDDGGTTWKKSDVGLVATGDASTYPTNLSPVSAAGAAQIVHQWAANPGDEDLSVAVMTAGGWSNWTADVTHSLSTPIADLDAERIGFGPTAVAGVTTNTWLPYDLPEDVGWTKTGAGTVTLVAGGWAEFVTTGANTAYYAPPVALGTATRFVGLFGLQVVAGGALATNDIAMRLRLSDGANGHDIAIRFKTDSFRIRDVLAGTNTDVTFDLTQAAQILVCATRAFVLEVLYRRPGGATWETAYSGSMTTGAIATGLFEIGHIAAAAATSRFRMMAISYGWATNCWDYSGSSESAITEVKGRTVTGRPFPMGDKATAGASFLAGKDGPARMAETFTITPAHDYGVDKLFYDSSPSLAEEWRSSDTSEQTFEFIPSDISSSTDTSPRSRSIVVGFLGGNFQTAYLEGDTGAGYVQLGAYDAAIDFSGLTASVDGDQVTPNTGATANASRYIQRLELVGSVYRDNAGTYAYILHNEEGGWTQSNTRRPRLTVDRAVTAGAARIICRNGVLVVHNITENYRKFRIRIPTQSTPDGFFRLAALPICGLVVPGLPWDWGWTEADEPVVSEYRSRRGTTRRLEEGPPIRVLTFGWSNGGVPIHRLRAGLDSDYITADAGHGATAALATHKDVPWLMAAVLRETKSGQIPVIALKVVPQTSTYTSITDPSHFIYGRIESSVQFGHVTGKTGVAEYGRMENVSVKELR